MLMCSCISVMASIFGLAAGGFGQAPAGSLSACPSRDGAARYCVTLAIRKGFTARVNSVLNPGSSRLVPDQKQLLDAYLDQALRRLGRPYRQILSSEDLLSDSQGALNNDPDRLALHDVNLSLAEYAGLLQDWCDRYDNCQASAFVVFSPAGLYRDFSEYQDAPLLFDPAVDLFDAESGEVVFRVPAPFDSATAAIRIPTLAPAREQSRIRALRKWLRGLDGTTFLRQAIAARITAFYLGMGLEPEISISFDPPAPSITILEGSRVAALAFPYGLPGTNGVTDWRKTAVALYSVLPDAVFRHGYLNNRPAIQRRMTASAAPVLDLHADLGIDPQDLPYASRRQIPIEQFLLQQNGFSLTATGTSRHLLNIAGPDGMPVTAEFSLLNLRLAEIGQPSQPAPAKPVESADANSKACCAGNSTPARTKARLLGIGGEYLPGQGIRALTLVQQSALPVPLMDAALSLRAGFGGGSAALASAGFSADFIAFDRLRHRLSFAIQGGQDSMANRFLSGRAVEEYRRGAMARAEFEWFRDRGGHLLKLFAEGHRRTVTLTSPASGGGKQNLTTITLGAVHLYQSGESPLPWLVRLEPSLEFAAAGENQPRFHCGRLAARLEHTLPDRLALVFAGQYEDASAATPEFELPSLGGAASVRGFRQDDALGQRLWTLQSELWTPLPAFNDVDFVRDNLRLAAFFDVGNAYRLRVVNPAFRKGTGLGLRVTYGPVVLKADLARGFGQSATHSRRIQFYFGTTINLPI